MGLGSSRLCEPKYARFRAKSTGKEAERESIDIRLNG